MKYITFEHVYTLPSGNVRVYKASRLLSNKADGKKYRDEPEVVKLYTNKEKTETKEVTFSNSFEYVAISDAHTHIERLAFPCWKYEPIISDSPYFWQCDTIAGVNTFMIHGGDSRTVKPDQVYLRMLARGNGFQYKRS